MFNFLKSLKKVKRKSDKTYDDYFKIDDEGRYAIHIKGKDLNSFTQEYEISGYNPINFDFFNHLEQYVNPLKLQAKFNIYIEIGSENEEKKETSDEEKQKFVRSFKHYYMLKTLNLEREKKHNKFIAWMCIAIFFVFFSILIATEYVPFLHEHFPDFAWEILVIIEWVFGWEAVDRLAFLELDLNAQEIKAYHLYNSHIKFRKLTKKQSSDVLKSFDPSNIGYFKKYKDTQSAQEPIKEKGVQTQEKNNISNMSKDIKS